MFLFEKLNHKDLLELVKNVEEDTINFVENELYIYNLNPDSKPQNSVIVNIALLNLSTIKYEVGFNQLENLLNYKYDQSVGIRLKQFQHILEIKYGSYLNDVKKRSINSFISIYELDSGIVHYLYKKYNELWLIPIIKQAYDIIMKELQSNSKIQ